MLLTPVRSRVTMVVVCLGLLTAVGGVAFGQATAASNFALLPGFKVELLHTVPAKTQGSWVSLAIDPKGRLLTSDQYGKLYRVTPPGINGAKKIQIESLPVNMGRAHGLLYAFDSLYVVVSEQQRGTNAKGLYRLKDTNGDDQFDEIKLLRKIGGGGEHGPHSIILGPKGKYIYLAAGNHTDLPNPEKSLVPRTWDEDQLLPRLWDAGGHAVNKLAPGGWICRLNPDGTEFELVSSGYRNQFDIAFNTDGELFTFDADMEWDIGSPWYRPTRVCHATSGSEFGWRSGTGKWPSFYPDNLPAVADIGPGSPTGIAFGTGAKFPAKYQKALYISDWSYGVMYAVHLEPKGSSYTATFERFVTAAPLPLTDIVIHPKDGAMYFTVGGRRTQSALYRVTYEGDASTAAVQKTQIAGADARRLRHLIETQHYAGAPKAVQLGVKHLGIKDRFIRYAARIALEHQPVEKWADTALAHDSVDGRINAVIALARSRAKKSRNAMLKTLAGLDWNSLSRSQKLDVLRAYSLVFIRLGPLNDSRAQRLAKQFEASYPSQDQALNQELCRLLVYLKAPSVVGKTLDLLSKADTQEEQIHYVLALSSLKDGWTSAQRKEYFQWFPKAAQQRGGHSFVGFRRNIRAEAIKLLSDAERVELKNLIEMPLEPKPTVAIDENRKLVKKWAIADLLADAQKLESRDFNNGRKMFAVAACFKCHRFDGTGGIVGPDLTGVSGRFNAQNLLESIIEPSKTISDQYRASNFITVKGQTIVGRVANLSNEQLMIVTNMLEPGNFTRVKRSDIDEIAPSKVSMMPTGLLDTLTKDEVLDLLAYLKSRGNPNDPVFKK